MSEAFVLTRRRRRLRPYLDLTAMIDTVFNLLIFFAVTTTFVGARTGLPMEIPSAETVQQVPERVVMTLLPGRPAQVNDKVVSDDEIGQALREASGGDADVQVAVVADSRVPYSQLVTAIDKARIAGFHRIALAASPNRDEHSPDSQKP